MPKYMYLGNRLGLHWPLELQQLTYVGLLQTCQIKRWMSMLKKRKRLNQLVDPNNHQKGLTAKGLSSFRVNLFMKRPTLKEIQSSLQQLGQTGSLLKEGTNEHKSTYHPRGEPCWWSLLAQLLLVVTQGNHQGWELHVWCSGSQNAGGQKLTNWLWGCWPKISDKIHLLQWWRE